MRCHRGGDGAARAGDDGAWSSFDAALLAATDQLHRDAIVATGPGTSLPAAYDDEQLIELMLLVGQYHLVAFATNSLGIQNEELPAASTVREGGLASSPLRRRPHPPRLDQQCEGDITVDPFVGR